ncbi:phytanoyl-CoA dioxygenase [Sorangium cellulosum]|uniref:Phytanoyl-CoA dioxygenase n=1 Tax=Sorangium cellulosum TaxID=56 RepID=A0A4V0NEW7_SORCE|nr:phytanoyl-CoA dioxygenase family protein [Sorangium cellulosum]AUX27612.1 phytanoyl-CoA dioxygenase [Sorangium cellulosum]
MSHSRYTSAEIEELARAARRDGFCVIKNLIPKGLLRSWRDAFMPLLDAHIAREGHLRNRGPERYYVTLPFKAPFAEPRIYEDETVLGVVSRLVGDDMIMVQLATDTPLLGSDYQDVHRDAPPLFPETAQETPAFQLAVNFPLVDVTADNGPIEIARGTHLLTRAEGLRRLAAGEIALEPVMMELGDVMVRDVRGLHRGTPNRTREPRPMVVIGYSRRWLFRPEVSIRVPRASLAHLSGRAKQMLRFNPVVESLDGPVEPEIYQAFAY